MARCDDDAVVRGQIAAHDPQARVHEVPPADDPLHVDAGGRRGPPSSGLSRPDTWFRHLGGLPEVDGGQLVGHEVHGPAPVDRRRAEGEQLTPQALGDLEAPTLERHPAALAHPPALIVGPVGQGRQLGRIGPRPDVVATGGHG